MSSNTIAPPTGENISPKAWYQGVRASPDFFDDAAQAAVVDALDVLWHQLVDFKTRRNQFLGHSLLNPDVPKGLYLWGGVGRGKTFLMDAFYACLPYRRKRRIHFHNFMAEVHHEMKLLAHENDPLIALADNIEKSTRLLCLDEFHVDDIADAMILRRLITALFERGVVLITTSNQSPDELYLHGLQRQIFLPAIALLKHELTVLHIDNGKDYRTQIMAREPLFIVPANEASETKMEALFEKITSDKGQNSQSVEINGRKFPVKRFARNVVWFDFSELCCGAHAQEDYLLIAHHFPTVFLSHIPRMHADQAAEARRFTWLIDVLYDNNVRLVASAEAMPDELDADGAMPDEFSRTTSRLAEMQTQRYLQLPHHARGISL
ncbi:MAG: cell division protein ZapE [Gallionella sp.]